MGVLSRVPNTSLVARSLLQKTAWPPVYPASTHRLLDGSLGTSRILHPNEPQLPYGGEGEGPFQVSI